MFDDLSGNIMPWKLCGTMRAQDVNDTPDIPTQRKIERWHQTQKPHPTPRAQGQIADNASWLGRRDWAFAG